MKHKIILLLTLCSCSIFGQNLEKIERDLLKHFQKITYWADYNGDEKINSSDSLQKENTIFSQKLLAYTNREASTLTYAFKELKNEGLNIATSTDKNFRIYSWDTQTGGSMHYFDNIYQFKQNNKVISQNLNDKRQQGDFGSWFSEIFSLKTENKTVYLGYWNAIYSNSSCGQGIKLFSIENGQLNDSIKLIKTKTGIKNKLSFEFDFFSVVDRKERPVKLIYYNPIEKTIKIPVVTDMLKVTNKFITYKYGGQYFERQLK